MTEESMVEEVEVASAAPEIPADGASRPRDHAAIDRLATSLVPELIARLSGSGLGEIEIRQDDWKVRVRRPAAVQRRPSAEAAAASGRRQSGPSRPQPGHAGHGHAPAALERTVAGGRAAADGNGNGSLGEGAASVAVTSPAVGVYRAGKQPSGARVRSGDRIGAVDMLGVPQDVVAPVDGFLGESLVEPGEAVEYGQELLRIEPVEAAR